MTPNEVRITLHEWLETAPPSQLRDEIAYLLLEGDFEPDLLERLAAAMGTVLAIKKLH